MSSVALGRLAKMPIYAARMPPARLCDLTALQGLAEKGLLQILGKVLFLQLAAKQFGKSRFVNRAADYDGMASGLGKNVHRSLAAC